MDVVAFASVSELIDKLLQLERTPGRRLWFRGQGCADYQLRPKLCRGQQRDMADVYEREARLLARFRERSLPFWAAGYPQSTWEHLFSMQHHGVPTRLLDWSENALIAAYFAAASDSSHDHQGTHDGGCTPTVWMLDPIEWNSHVPQLADSGVGILTVADDEQNRWAPQTNTSGSLTKRAKLPVAMYGVHNSPRIVAQRGAFTISGDDWASMDEVANGNENLGSSLYKFEAQVDHDYLAKELSILGFTESMIYPDLMSLARELTDLEGWANA